MQWTPDLTLLERVKSLLSDAFYKHDKGTQKTVLECLDRLPREYPQTVLCLLYIFANPKEDEVLRIIAGTHFKNIATSYMPTLPEIEQTAALNLIIPLFQSQLQSYRMVACMGMLSLIRAREIWPDLRDFLINGTLPGVMNPAVFQLTAMISEDMPTKLDSCDPPIQDQLLTNILESMRNILTTNDVKYITDDTTVLTSIVRLFSALIGISSPYVAPNITKYTRMLLVLCERIINYILSSMVAAGSAVGVHSQQTEFLLAQCVRSLVTITLQSAHSLVGSRLSPCDTPINGSPCTNQGGRDMLNDVVDFIVAMAKLCLYGTIDVYNNYAKVDILDITTPDRSPYQYDVSTFHRVAKNPSPFEYSMTLEVFEFFPALCDFDENSFGYCEDYNVEEGMLDFEETDKGSVAVGYLRPYLFQLIHIFCDGIVYGASDIDEIEDYFGRGGPNKDIAYAKSKTANDFREGSYEMEKVDKKFSCDDDCEDFMDETGNNERGISVIEKWSVRKICALSLENVLTVCTSHCSSVLADRLLKAMTYVRQLPRDILMTNDVTLLIDSIVYGMAPLANVSLDSTAMVFNNVCDIISLYSAGLPPSPGSQLDKYKILAISGACVCIPRINFTRLFEEAKKGSAIQLLISRIKTLLEQLIMFLINTNSKCIISSISNAVGELIKTLVGLVQEGISPPELVPILVIIIGETLPGLTYVLALVRNDQMDPLLEFTRTLVTSLVALVESMSTNSNFPVEAIAPYETVGSPKRCFERSGGSVYMYIPGIIDALFGRIVLLTDVFNSECLCFYDLVLQPIFDSLECILLVSGKETTLKFVDKSVGISLMQLTGRVIGSVLEETKIIGQNGVTSPNYGLVNTILGLWATFIDRALLFGASTEEALGHFTNRNEVSEILETCFKSSRTEAMNGICVFFGEVVKRDPKAFLQLCDGKALEKVFMIISTAICGCAQDTFFCNAIWFLGLLFRNVFGERPDLMGLNVVGEICASLRSYISDKRSKSKNIKRLNLLILVSRMAKVDRRRAMMVIHNDFGGIDKLCGGEPMALLRRGDDTEKLDVFAGVYAIAAQILEDQRNDPSRRNHLDLCRVQIVRLIGEWKPEMPPIAIEAFDKLLLEYASVCNGRK